MEKRKGCNLFKEFPHGEVCVAMLEFKGVVLVATNKHIYKIVDEVLHKLEIINEE